MSTSLLPTLDDFNDIDPTDHASYIDMIAYHAVDELEGVRKELERVLCIRAASVTLALYGHPTIQSVESGLAYARTLDAPGRNAFAEDIQKVPHR